MNINKILRCSVIFPCLLLFSTISMGQDKNELLIVTFGNSTTAPRKGIEKVYAVRVNEMLTAAGIKNRVINSGIGGSHSGSVKDNDYTKIQHGLDRFDKTVLSHQADWVTINFGLNDAWQDKGVNGKSRIPIDKYTRNILYFIEMVKNQNGRVILLTPNPIGSKHEKWRYKRVKQYMKAAKKIARNNNVPLINSWKLFYNYTRKDPKSIDSLLPDAVHPNDTGHRLIAEEIVRIIMKSEN